MPQVLRPYPLIRRRSVAAEGCARLRRRCAKAHAATPSTVTPAAQRGAVSFVLFGGPTVDAAAVPVAGADLVSLIPLLAAPREAFSLTTIPKALRQVALPALRRASRSRSTSNIAPQPDPSAAQPTSTRPPGHKRPGLPAAQGNRRNDA